MVEPSTFTEIKDCFAHVAIILVVTSKLEAGLWIVSAQSQFRSVLNITDVAQKSDATSKIFGFAIELECFLDIILSFKELSPPFVQCWLALSNDELLETVNLVHCSQHTRDFTLVSVG
jgi:hypothetical protein